MKTNYQMLIGLVTSFLLVVGLLWPSRACGAEARISEIRSESENTVVLENEFVRMTVDMLHGARVTGFCYKPLDQEWIYSGQGLFADHVWQQTWPGELYNAKYDYEITEKGPARVSVRVWRSLEQKSKEGVVGVKVERKLILSADSPAVTVEVAMTNPTDRVKTVGYWSQHILHLGGPSDQFNIRPFIGGLSVATFDLRDGGRVRERVGQEFVKDPAAGWTATLNPTTGEAAVFLMDYNDLRWLYNCIGSHTTEWYYDLLRMAPGRRWETKIVLLPLRGYRGVSFASKEIIADVRLVESNEGFRLVYTLGCGVAPLDEVSLQAELVAPAKGRALGSETVKFGSVGDFPREFTSSLTVPRKGEPFVVRVNLKGKGFSHDFAKHFGDYNRTDRLVAGVFKTGYSVKPPPKQKASRRSVSIRKIAHEGLAVFEARGQFYPAWRLEEALKLKGKYVLKAGRFSCDVYGEQMDSFPAGYEEIMATDVVVLNNVTADCLTPDDKALLKDYVQHGGGLLVFGGWYAFGGGGYAESALAELLPVESGKPFDIRRYEKGLPLTGAESTLQGVKFSGKSVVFWLQEVPQVKKEAQVVLKAGAKPLIVVGSCGKGRVACVLTSPLGESTQDATLFCEDDQWPAVLGRLVDWLKGAATK
ncbi:MAG: glutamine amidotransferase [Kiritimatiellae bacterium]|nr:glutamine amidotransferase [Kiritimatiellia bacterium]